MPTNPQPEPAHTDPSGPSDPSGETLLRELRQACTVLREQMQTDATAKDSLAVIRTVPGIPRDLWPGILPRLAGDGWLAFPLDGPMGQALQAMQEQFETLLYQRDHDPLTGLANRRLFNVTLEQEIRRGERTHTELSLVMLDLDDFKQVNDRYGHPVGDQVLSRFGALLHDSIRPYDLAARVGGEEFCLVLPGTSAWQARALVQRILTQFRKETFSGPKSNTFSLSFSAGIATSLCHLDGLAPKALFTLADETMYQAKKEGKNRVIAASLAGGVTDTPSLVHADEKHFLFFGEKP